MKRNALAFVTLAIVAAIILLIACNTGGQSSSSAGNGRSTSGSGTGTALISTTLSDPTTCSAPQGPYSHIYVTIVDVKASTNADASDSDSSFVDLTPNLRSAPVQVDLLGIANNQCFLATLGSATPLVAGTYQQIRVFLADNVSTPPVGNKCIVTSSVNASNCVQLAADGSFHTLQLSSEAKTGIKIPSDQIGGGGLKATAGASQDLNIDFDACASVVIQDNGAYRLKPVLHAGEITNTSTSISGQVVDKATNAPIVGGRTMVALEQKDSTNIDRVVMQTATDDNGNFNFCPVPSGTYDVVMTAVNGSGIAYATTVTRGVQPGNVLGGASTALRSTQIQAVPQIGTNTGPASLTGLVTTAGGTPTPPSVDVSVSALEVVGTSLTITVPSAQQSSATVSLATASSPTLACPTGTACQRYTLSVPAVAPTIGAFSANGTTYTPGTGTATYTVEGRAFVPSSGGKNDCSPSIVSSTAVAVTPGNSFAVPNLNFTGCQ